MLELVRCRGGRRREGEEETLELAPLAGREAAIALGRGGGLAAVKEDGLLDGRGPSVVEIGADSRRPQSGGVRHSLSEACGRSGLPP